MAEPASLLQQWIAKAEEDWEAAQLLSSSPSQAATTCFHCQQCAEKLLKTALLTAGGTIPKTHDLRILSSLLSERDPLWIWDLDVLEDLNAGAVASRYPGYAVDRQDAADSLNATRTLRRTLLNRLQIQPGS